MKLITKTLTGLLLATALGYAYWKYAIPIHRVEVQSKLFMLGDLDGDLPRHDGESRPA